ncbi:spore coat protein [Clostridium sp. Marseille-P299]|uniref:spore coat protein n=1 Tax=Clostridium sp. Marseille-P299 TaxID=1805477 RepID=UPI000833848E|nr:spore coat protein [Clostridium sp. Marseille-P299]
MQEKAMVTDALNAINNGLKGLEDMITQTEHQDLRQTLIKMRNDTETSQYELFSIAKNKNYYTPAKPATPQDIESVKSSICKTQTQF